MSNPHANRTQGSAEPSAGKQGTAIPFTNSPVRQAQPGKSNTASNEHPHVGTAAESRAAQAAPASAETPLDAQGMALPISADQAGAGSLLTPPTSIANSAGGDLATMPSTNPLTLTSTAPSLEPAPSLIGGGDAGGGQPLGPPSVVANSGARKDKLDPAGDAMGGSGTSFAATLLGTSGQPNWRNPGSGFDGDGVSGRPGSNAAGKDTAASPSGTGEQTTLATVAPHISAGRLVQSLQSSQMQVSVHSEDFGRVSIQTAYGHTSISAQITLDGSQLASQLGSALSSHVPAMEQKLSADHGLHATVTVDTQARGGATPDGGGDPRRQRSAPSQPLPSSASPSAPAPTDPIRNSRAALAASSNRLDIRI